MTDSIIHEGVKERSGRYPWGSGENPYQRLRNFEGMWKTLSKKGYSEVEIAKQMGFDTVKEFRSRKKLANLDLKKMEISKIHALKDKGWSNSAIGREIGRGESYIRNVLSKEEKYLYNKVEGAANQLEKMLESGAIVDVGKGVAAHLGISDNTLNDAVKLLEERGYKKHIFNTTQLANDKPLNRQVIAPADVNYYDLQNRASDIQMPAFQSRDLGETYTPLRPPANIDSKRVFVRYGEDGGGDKDGIIELRSGVPDLSLGDSKYAQVRIAVDGTNYMKGVAMYNDDAIPKGYDIVYNTPKSKSHPMLGSKDADPILKPMKDNPDNPFGSSYTQREFIGKDGKPKLSPLNIVNEEGSWAEWSRTLSSQVLSKQTVALAKRQLDLAYATKSAELKDIMSLDNPAVKKRLLETFADSADSDAVHLKAAALPRQQTKLLIPIPELKDTEIFAPGFNHGEAVALIRYPHGGRFEIPELKVNNTHKQSKKLLDGAVDAVGINPKVAERLSGADFDGDTVLVIPQNKEVRIRTAPPLAGLADFDPKARYKGEPGKFKPMTNTQTQMGEITNLINDMTLKGASESELARAVKHSMVVIDAEKHGLDYKQSEKDHRIRELRDLYQPATKPGGRSGGASTLLSRAKGRQYVPERRPRRASEGGPIDPKTGELVYVETGATKPKKLSNGTWTKEPKLVRSTQMAETRDARTLSSGTPMEELYAGHANRLKAMANEARKELLATPQVKRDPKAARVYAKEVETLNESLRQAYMNKPLERRAQALASEKVRLEVDSNPELKGDHDAIKKLKTRALGEARGIVGAKRAPVKISDREWEAIQKGAISNNKLSEILDNTDVDALKDRALPKKSSGLSASMEAMAKSYHRRGYSLEDIARHLGVSPSAISKAVSPKK